MFGPLVVALVLLWSVFLGMAVMTGSGLVLGTRPDASGLSFRDPGFTGSWLLFLSGTVLSAFAIVRVRMHWKARRAAFRAGGQDAVRAGTLDAGMRGAAEAPRDEAPRDEAPPTGVLLVGTEVPRGSVPCLYTSPAFLGARRVSSFTAVRCEGGEAAAAGIVLGRAPFDESPPTMEEIPVQVLRDAFRRAGMELRPDGVPAKVYLAHVWEV